MNAERKAEWVAALRSGEFVQGQGRLRTQMGDEAEPRFCCLGVACELFRRENPELGSWNGDLFFAREAGQREGESTLTMLPEAVRGWLGVTSTDPMVEAPCALELPSSLRGVEHVVELSALNDHGASFELIAKLIEEHL